MKKTYLLLLSICLAAAVVSCSKGDVEIPDDPQTTTQDKSGSDGSGSIDMNSAETRLGVTVARLFSSYVDSFDQQFVPTDTDRELFHKTVITAALSGIMSEDPAAMALSAYQSWRVHEPETEVNHPNNPQFQIYNVLDNANYISRNYRIADYAPNNTQYTAPCPEAECGYEYYNTLSTVTKLENAFFVATPIEIRKAWIMETALALGYPSPISECDYDMLTGDVDGMLWFRQDDEMLWNPRPWPGCFTLEDGIEWTMMLRPEYELEIELLSLCLPAILAPGKSTQDKFAYFDGIVELCHKPAVQRDLWPDKQLRFLNALSTAMYASIFWENMTFDPIYFNRKSMIATPAINIPQHPDIVTYEHGNLTVEIDTNIPYWAYWYQNSFPIHFQLNPNFERNKFNFGMPTMPNSPHTYEDMTLRFEVANTPNPIPGVPSSYYDISVRRLTYYDLMVNVSVGGLANPQHIININTPSMYDNNAGVRLWNLEVYKNGTLTMTQFGYGSGMLYIPCGLSRPGMPPTQIMQVVVKDVIGRVRFSTNLPYYY